jgi:hypothetical protein
MLCFLCSTHWIIKYYLDKQQLLKVNYKYIYEAMRSKPKTILVQGLNLVKVLQTQQIMMKFQPKDIKTWLQCLEFRLPCKIWMELWTGNAMLYLHSYSIMFVRTVYDILSVAYFFLSVHEYQQQWWARYWH